MKQEKTEFFKNYDSRIVEKIKNYDLVALKDFAKSVSLELYCGDFANFDKIGIIEALANLDLPFGIIEKIYQKLEIDGGEESSTKLSADEIEKIFEK